MSKKTDIVVRITGNHPTGSRRRAGFTFSKVPALVSVTDEELKMIKEDKFLIIVTKGGALEQAVKQDKKDFSEEGTSAEGSSAKVLVKDDLTKDQIIEQLTEMGIEFNKRANKDELFAVLEEAIAKQSEGTSEEGDSADLNALSIEEIVAKLEEKGLVEGKDFTKDAEKEALIELLHRLA